MARLRVKLDIPEQLVTQPIIHHLALDHHLATNIRRAGVTGVGGFVVLEVNGDDADIERALDDARTMGVQVTLVGGDIIKG